MQCCTKPVVLRELSLLHPQPVQLPVAQTIWMIVSGLTAAILRPAHVLPSVHSNVFVTCLHCSGCLNVSPKMFTLCGNVSSAYLHPVKLLT